MFMVRAVFWITVVALLLPHEPNLGLGRPDALTGVFSGVAPALAAATGHPEMNCSGDACKAGVAVLDKFQATALVALARLKLEIEEQQRVREHASGA